jgi:hypothetical protein
MKKQTETEYIVEKILDKKKFKKDDKYLVKWLGYAESKSTWEPISHLTKCLDLIVEFEKSRDISAAAENEEKKFLGKRKRISSEEREDGKSSESFPNKKKKLELERENLLKSPTNNKIKSGSLIEQLNSIKSDSSSSAEKDLKPIASIKSPEKINHKQSLNDKFRDSGSITSPKMVTRTMLRKSEDDKIIENVYEK